MSFLVFLTIFNSTINLCKACCPDDLRVYKRRIFSVWKPELIWNDGTGNAATAPVITVNTGATKTIHTLQAWNPCGWLSSKAIFSAETVQKGNNVNYWPRPVKGAEQTYDQAQRECVAVALAVKILIPYLEELRFSGWMYHKSSQWMPPMIDQAWKVGRWRICQDEVDFEAFHKSNVKHEAPHGICRLPMTGGDRYLLEDDEHLMTTTHSQLDGKNTGANSKFVKLPLHSQVLYKESRALWHLTPGIRPSKERALSAKKWVKD